MIPGESIDTAKAWVVTADMGYGHQRAVHPLRDIAEDSIITVGKNDATSPGEAKLWKRVLGAYEFLSRAKSLPVIGNPIFNLLDTFLHIPRFYPMRDLSNTTFQVNLLESSIKKGLCSGMMEKISQKSLPVITSFYASAIAADRVGHNNVYCIICDADLNRVWVAKEPWDSNITYLAPCGKAAQRLKAYGVPNDRIIITGFPLPTELLGDKDLDILKQNLRERLYYLDPKKLFKKRYGASVSHFLNGTKKIEEPGRKLTLTYAVGGAGAQKEIAGRIIKSLTKKIQKGKIRIVLVAGTKPEVRDYFYSIKNEINADDSEVKVIYHDNIYEYFSLFNDCLKTTDILWTKPSEMSFYTALGLPVIMTPAIGSQEKFNRKWLFNIQSGIKQENPDYTDQWLFDMLKKGILADAAWSGFLKARKLGTYKIKELLATGTLKKDKSPVMR